MRYTILNSDWTTIAGSEVYYTKITKNWISNNSYYRDVESLKSGFIAEFGEKNMKYLEEYLDSIKK